MSLSTDSVIAKHRTELIRWMREYMQDTEVAYDENDIARCDALLAKFLEEISAAPDRTSGLQLVKQTVLALNELNDRCDGELIETDQREDICALLARAGHLRGFNDADEDTTEEWREW
ncbi:hypothetical protein BH11MYX3_BH11MYX3_04480 [soil metagenome]